MSTSRIRISEQMELSANAGSVIVTDSNNKPQYVAPGSNGQVLGISAGVPGYISVPSAAWYAENSTPPNVAPIANGNGSIAIGNEAEALDGDMVVWGNSAGKSAVGGAYSVFLGNGAGYQATSASSSVFIGISSGFQASLAQNAVFIGGGAGTYSSNAVQSVFIGNVAGQLATYASSSVMIGTGAGYGAANAGSSIFIGNSAGVSSVSANNSVFIGNNAGNNAPQSAYSIMIGDGAGSNDMASISTLEDGNILIGNNTSSGGFKNIIALGTLSHPQKDSTLHVSPFYDVTLEKYVSSRDDTSMELPQNFLYTNGKGDMLSSPIGTIMPTVGTVQGNASLAYPTTVTSTGGFKKHREKSGTLATGISTPSRSAISGKNYYVRIMGFVLHSVDTPAVTGFPLEVYSYITINGTPVGAAQSSGQYTQETGTGGNLVQGNILNYCGIFNLGPSQTTFDIGIYGDMRTSNSNPSVPWTGTGGAIIDYYNLSYEIFEA